MPPLTGHSINDHTKPQSIYMITVQLLFMKYMYCYSVSVCLAVRSHISIITRSNFIKSSAFYMWPWLSPSLTAMQHVMYFRFCEWRHVFTQWSKWARNSESIKRRCICFTEFNRWRHRGENLSSL